MFHVSLLKPAYVPIIASLDLPITVVDIIPYPQAVLDRKIVKRRKAATQWLIHWAGSSPTNATWKLAEEIKARFSAFVP